MKLHWSPRSPFVRKVMIGLREAGLENRVKTMRSLAVATKPNPDIQKDNPLNKIPTLVLDDGSVLYDSRVILEYLDTLHSGPRLCPAEGAARFDILRRQALADGLMDFVLLWRHELMRPTENQSKLHLAAFEQKANTVVDRMEAEIDGLAAAPFGVAHIATGCALSHLDFRFASFDWKSGHPKLAAWHKIFRDRPSVLATPIVDDE
jgi:glutathione S-transferase